MTNLEVDLGESYFKHIIRCTTFLINTLVFSSFEFTTIFHFGFEVTRLVSCNLAISKNRLFALPGRGEGEWADFRLLECFLGLRLTLGETS